MRGHKDLRLIVALAPVCGALALLIGVEAAALVFAAPLALFLPGYAIATAAFARRRLRLAPVLLLGVSLSLATLVLGALLLNYIGGIHPLSWAVLLVGVVLAGARVAAVRRPAGEGGAVVPRIRVSGAKAAMLVAALAAAVAALVLSDAPVPANRAIGFTQLWIVPKPGSDRSAARVGVRSQLQAPVRLDLRIKVGAGTIVRRSFRLRPGGTRQVIVRAPAGSLGRIPVIATLLRHNRPFEAYRRVRGTLIAGPQPR